MKKSLLGCCVGFVIGVCVGVLAQGLARQAGEQEDGQLRAVRQLLDDGHFAVYIRLGRVSSYVPLLQGELRGRSPSRRHRAGLALLLAGHREGLEPTLDGIKAEKADYRQIALAALAQQRDPSLYRVLREGLADPSKEVRIGAVSALGMFCRRNGLALEVSDVASSLESGDTNSMMAALITVRMADTLADPEAFLTRLLKIVHGKNNDVLVRRRAARIILKRFGDQLSDDEARRARLLGSGSTLDGDTILLNMMDFLDNVPSEGTEHQHRDSEGFGGQPSIPEK